MKTLKLIGLLCLFSSAALAQTWSITNVNNSAAVMGEISKLTFQVTNTGGTNTLNQVVLTLNQNNYDIDGGEAPAGWTVTTVDKNNRTVTYTANTCAGGLAVGQSALFTITV